MSPPRRRSARLRGNTPSRSNASTIHKLPSLAEHARAHDSDTQSDVKSPASSPMMPRTPVDAARVQPSREEMHPSLAQRSTVKHTNEGMLFGFKDVYPGKNEPSGQSQQTPSKTPAPMASFDFRFARPAPELGPDAQRLLSELQGEALRIKAKLAAERQEQKQAGDGDLPDHLKGRRIAQPKGKSGRFSNAHVAEFEKMDSIAGHASAFRAAPGRVSQPVAAGSLKRSPSKASLDDFPGSTRSYNSSSKHSQPDRPENTNPAKRARQHISHDASTIRPVSQDSNCEASFIPKPLQSHFGTLSALSTPTKASLARAASVKHSVIKGSGLPRSASKFSLATTPGGMVRSATTSKLTTAPATKPKTMPMDPVGTLDRVKSILRRPLASTSKTNLERHAPISSLMNSPTRPNLGKDLPSLPTTPRGPSSYKRVNFTPDVVAKHDTLLQQSSSPVKSGIPRSGRGRGLMMGMAESVVYPAISTDTASGEVKYPSLTISRPLPEPPRLVRAASNPPPPATATSATTDRETAPGTFTFRSDRTLDFRSPVANFAAAASAPSPSTGRSGGIRQVRPSIQLGDIPGSFPGDINNNNNDNDNGNNNDKENMAASTVVVMPAIPHGMPNKKRRREDADGDDTEDGRKGDCDDFASVGHSSKKQRPDAAKGEALLTAKMRTPKGNPKGKNITSPSKGRGFLSVSRLNMLARPKMRK